MFKVTTPMLSRTVTGSSEMAVVDVQLVGDGLALDPVFTIDKGRPKTGTRGVVTHTSLVDALSEEELLAVRRMVARLLSRLHEDGHFLCFVTGATIPPDVLEGLNILFSVTGYCHELETNGRVSLVQIEPDDVEYIVRGFGYYDALRWVALSDWDKDLPGLVSRLGLLDIVPTTYEGNLFQRPKFAALKAALTHGRFLFEELKNGTCLRVSSDVVPCSELSDRVHRLLRA
jgi:hypothetical protein